jgi:hypothetical protein
MPFCGGGGGVLAVVAAAIAVAVTLCLPTRFAKQAMLKD